MTDITSIPRQNNNEIVATLDEHRREEIARHAGLAANLWMSIKLAAARGDDNLIHKQIGDVRAVSKEVVDLARNLGTGEDDHEV